MTEGVGRPVVGLDSAVPPTLSQLRAAARAGVRLWSGYLATRPHVDLLHPWSRADFARVRAAGLRAIAYCSGHDDPAACRARAAEWEVPLCLDVERGIRADGPWVADWLAESGAGLYGAASVFHGRRAPFCVLAWFVETDPARSWPMDGAHPAPGGPRGWQWRGSRSEFGATVDRGWYDGWFAGFTRPLRDANGR